MSDLTSSTKEFQMPAEIETMLDEMLQEMYVLNEKMRLDQIEIDRLKAESRVITDHTDAVLAQINTLMDELRRKK